MPRKMPKSDDMKTHGKFDKKKFDASLPAAADALASGETKVHKIVIEDKHGKPEVKIHRSHSHNKDGLDPRIAVALQKLLVDLVNDGTVTIGDMTESPAVAEQDVLTVTAA